MSCSHPRSDDHIRSLILFEVWVLLLDGNAHLCCRQPPEPLPIASKNIYTTTAPGSQTSWISWTTLPSKSCYLKGAHHEAKGLQHQAMGSEQVHTLLRWRASAPMPRESQRSHEAHKESDVILQRGTWNPNTHDENLEPR